MKTVSVVGFVLLISLVFLAWGSLITDFEENYVITNISNVTPANQTILTRFNNASEINETINPIQRGFDDLATQDGFFDIIQDLAVVLPIAVIQIPFVVFGLFNIMVGNITDMLSFLGIPQELIFIALIGLIVFFIFKLVEFFGKHPM